VLALLAIPAGIIVWVIIWNFGFIASIVAFGVALLASFLYRLGSGGLISRTGAIRITVITLVTVLLSILAGLVSDVAIGISTVAGISPIEALSHPSFGTLFGLVLASGDTGLYFSIAIAVVFGFIGCFGILRAAWQQTAAAPEPAAFQSPWPTLSQNQDPQFPEQQQFGQQQFPGPDGQVPPTGEQPR
jgi:hypothetical protein